MMQKRNQELIDIQRTQFPLTVRETLKQFKNLLTDFEKTEILDYNEVFYIGHNALERKVHGKTSSRNYNYGYDDKNGDY